MHVHPAEKPCQIQSNKAADEGHAVIYSAARLINEHGQVTGRAHTSGKVKPHLGSWGNGDRRDRIGSLPCRHGGSANSGCPETGYCRRAKITVQETRFLGRLAYACRGACNILSAIFLVELCA